MYKGMHCSPPPFLLWVGVERGGGGGGTGEVTFHRTDAIRGKRVLILNAQSDAKDIYG